jgi:hypothetical protein
MKARGSYRATWESIDDDRDWRRLSPLAKATFDTLKRRLGQYGIDTVAVESLPRIINCSVDDLETALRELETPKPDRPRGWIKREDDIIWIVNGLRFEPTLFVEGEKPNQNHRSAARKHGQHLYQLTRAAVVVEYMAYYALGAPDGMGDAIPHGIPKAAGMGGGMVGGITESESESENENDTESESDARARLTPPAEQKPAKPSVTDLPADVLEFGARFYRGAPAARRRKIADQLRRLARGDGVQYKGATIRAGSVERLARKCREVLDGNDVRKPDLAIAVLLAKLGDSSDLTDKNRQAEEKQRADENRQTAEDVRAADDWIEEQPDVAASIDEELDREGYTARKGDAIATMARTWGRRSLVLKAWRAAGAPILAKRETA